ncbi:hypothetical protein [Winogradskyella schleiferi]|uniref:hypothetical protein n=1 Tax=Winogradskyella schleiferi TaxID=2686078 RepID=UPI0015BCF92C|nr:hypothetical protein [Winogradskyella schleiferi]
MDDKKNIDRLFQEKFKDFEIAPNDTVWNRISESLPKKKKKRRVIALWGQLGGVAAVIALLLTVGVSLFNSDDNNAQDFPVVNTGDNSEKTNTKTSSDESLNELNTAENNHTKVVDSNLDSEKESNLKNSDDDSTPKTYPSNSNPLINPNNSNQKSNVVVTNSKVEEKTKASQKRRSPSTLEDEQHITKIANETNSNSTLKTDEKLLLEKNDKSLLNAESDRKSAIKKTIEDQKTAVADNKSSEKEISESLNLVTNKAETSEPENSLIEDLKKESIEAAIAENNETTDEEEKEDERNRWSIAPNVAPVYFSSLGQGSSLDQQFNDNAKSSDVNMSYGITGSYAISKKLKIRAGVNRVNLNQTTTDVFAFTGPATAARGVEARFGNISFSEGEQRVSLMSSTLMNRSSTPELINSKVAGNIEQKFGFIEIPIGLEYAVLDKKFGINVIGGFSTFILNDNEIYADVDGTSTLIGEANNINATSFSANFGLGMDYNLSKQWNFNLEPTFKYQLNTFNNTTGDFKPFFVGVYTGLSFKF